MIFDQLEFHNVEEIEDTKIGYRLHRFPRRVREKLGSVEGATTYGRYIADLTTGCEIRFVTEGDRVLLSLSAFDEDGTVAIYRGDFKVGYRRIEAGKINRIMLESPAGFDQLNPAFKKGDFAPDVWRIMSCHDFGLVYCGIETFGQSVRPPKAEELPKKTLLAYGTSLTHGAAAQAYPVSYINYLARLLHVDLLNKGMGGSCMNECAVADYIAASDAWDALYLENMTNMGEGMAKQYEEQTKYLLDKVCAAHPDKPVYAVTMFPIGMALDSHCDHPVKRAFALDPILRRLAAEHPNVTVIEGDTILTDFRNLMTDLVHFNDFGHIQVAENLAKVIRV